MPHKQNCSTITCHMAQIISFINIYIYIYIINVLNFANVSSYEGLFGGKTSWVKIWDAKHDLSYPTQCFRILFKHHAPSLLQCSQTLHPHFLLHDSSFCFKPNLQTLIHHEHTKTHLLKTPNPSTSPTNLHQRHLVFFSLQSPPSPSCLIKFNICKSDIWMLQEARNPWGLKAL
ncbi:hypothetical protein HanXRQr2_Chr04g0177421 [Helianthus annuus]|uniref:Uncharacterized protein n=1 Tax=Helianthus annuus TaxID=4232 RepID=A0A251S4L5_HELAN|nr:hypothetical protein HanXRQr2_Chr04g0177421 [Helianthus annuus]